MNSNTSASAAASTASGGGGDFVATHTLAADMELRVEVRASKKTMVKLVSGTAEIFGAELAPGKTYALQGVNVPIFTYHGCTLQLSGDEPSVLYEASETPMHTYVNAHHAIDRLREIARARHSAGPRVMIVGPTDAGKSSLARTLINYCVRSGYRPTYVDLDVGQNNICIPGCVAATPVDAPILDDPDAVLWWTTPLAFFFGHASPSNNVPLYKKMVSRLADAVMQRCNKHPTTAGVAGLIVNTCGWVKKDGYEVIVHCAEALQIDLLLVLADERLYSQLCNEPRLKGLQKTKLVRSGGVVVRKAQERKAARDAAIRRYFYGPSLKLNPHRQPVRFDSVHIFRVGSGPAAPLSTLPIGTERRVAENKLVRITPSQSLKNHILAVSYATRIGEAVLTTNVAGFIYVSEVDEEKGVLLCLTPSPGKLAGEYLIDGSVTWFER